MIAAARGILQEGCSLERLGESKVSQKISLLGYFAFLVSFRMSNLRIFNSDWEFDSH